MQDLSAPEADEAVVRRTGSRALKIDNGGTPETKGGTEKWESM